MVLCTNVILSRYYTVTYYYIQVGFGLTTFQGSNSNAERPFHKTLYIKCMRIVPKCALEQKSTLHQMFHCFSSPNGHSLKPKKKVM